MPKRKVLVTGACGKIAGQVLPALRERYELTLLDVKTTNREGQAVEGVQLADLVNKDRDSYRHFFRGIEAVTHFAFVGSSNPADGAEVAFLKITNIQHGTLFLHDPRLERYVVSFSNDPSYQETNEFLPGVPPDVLQRARRDEALDRRVGDGDSRQQDLRALDAARKVLGL